MCLAIWGNIGEQEISTDEDWLVAKELGMKFFFKPEYEAYNVAALVFVHLLLLSVQPDTLACKAGVAASFATLVVGLAQEPVYQPLNV